MREFITLLNDIEHLRSNLHDLISQKDSDLSDPEVIFASKMLNTSITNYTELIIEKSKL